MKDKKLPFLSDYMYACHPLILEKIAETADTPHLGYGDDEICASAKEKIRTAIQAPDAEIFFLIGGTPTNVIAIDALIPPYQGVLAADTGHISVHEAGAVEATGHKIITLPSVNGKVMAQTVHNYLKAFYADETWKHGVEPGMLYITHPTETGTLYTLSELSELSEVCRSNNIKLYLDGARLGYGLAATGSDITLPHIARLCDAFYIGGTKVGALMGEAIVFPTPGTVSHLFPQVKRHNNLLAKGWLLGAQFDALFTDNLYLSIARHGILMAEKLKKGILEKGFKLFADSPTNLQFIILPIEKYHQLRQNVDCEIWQELPDEQVAVRLCTSWHTTEEQVDQLLDLL